MDFFQIKVIEKVGKVFSYAMEEKRYDRYEFAEKWCGSEVFAKVLDFDETICSQAKTYILYLFEEEYAGMLPGINEESVFYAEDMYWLGYLLTYWCFLEQISGKEIFEKYNIKKILDEFEVLHTLSIQYAIAEIKKDDKI